jgi:hypothetical protein
MANQVAARLAGDEYQHLYSWGELLKLLISAQRLKNVTVEDPDAGSVDDVTERYETEAAEPDVFLQLKYHVDHRDQYSTDVFLETKGKGRSLLRKFYDSWAALRLSGRPVELRLVTNWTWDENDGVRKCIRGTDNALSDAFFSAPPSSEIGEARQRWRDHLSISDEEFRAFASTLRFRLGFDCSDELEERVRERMMHLRLLHDRASLLACIGIVRDIIKSRRPALVRADVETLLTEHGLYLPTTDEAATVVYLSTVKQQQFDVVPDFLLDWRSYFAGDDQKRVHQVLDATAWNARMLPELRTLEHQLNASSSTRLIRVRGLARLSAWFAFGHTFSEVARYTLEVDQQGRLWRTDEAPSDFAIVEHGREDVAGGDPDAVAVGISITGALEDDVRDHLARAPIAAAALFLRPARDLGPACFRSGGDVAAFARATKERLRAFVKEHHARRLVLYYFGPLSGACFLGHRLNAVAPEIQIMEDQQPGYAPAFVLT